MSIDTYIRSNLLNEMEYRFIIETIANKVSELKELRPRESDELEACYQALCKKLDALTDHD